MFTEEERHYIKEQYWRGESANSIADGLGCDRKTIGRRVREWGLQHCWENERVLQVLYWKRGMSTREIGDTLGCGKTTILRHMNEYEIQRRESNREKPPQYTLHTDGRGYAVIRHNGQWVYVHRLLAVAEFGYDAVVGSHIHHKSQIPWDNRPDNLEPLDAAQHAKRHHATETEA